MPRSWHSAHHEDPDSATRISFECHSAINLLTTLALFRSNLSAIVLSRFSAKVISMLSAIVP